jgi:hypothetical protein
MIYCHSHGTSGRDLTLDSWFCSTVGMIWWCEKLTHPLCLPSLNTRDLQHLEPVQVTVRQNDLYMCGLRNRALSQPCFAEWVWAIKSCLPERVHVWCLPTTGKEKK